ncbi:MAG: hypothetical protein RIC89_15900 [Pseudomonadales bacterium]
MQKPKDEQLDRLIGEHFDRQNTPAADFAQLWQRAEQDVASRAEARHRRRWMRLATAAVLLVGVGGVLVATDLLPTDSPPDGQIAQFALDKVDGADGADGTDEEMQQQMVSTTRWRAPSDRFLDQTRPLPGWQLPGRDALQMEEVL